jgi:hypothetical protein
MQQIEQLPELGHDEQNRVDRVVETLTTLGNHGESVAEVAHDARNMVTALGKLRRNPEQSLDHTER